MGLRNCGPVGYHKELHAGYQKRVSQGNITREDHKGVSQGSCTRRITTYHKGMPGIIRVSQAYQMILLTIKYLLIINNRKITESKGLYDEIKTKTV